MPYDEIDLQTFAARRDEAGTVVVDVREPDEYAEAHVPGAINIPLGQLAGRAGEIPDGDVLCICKSGGRSLQGADVLAAGGRTVSSVAGGTMGWIRMGRETASGDQPG